jgi:hypothetical protein
VGKRNIFLSPQSQLRNLKAALPQSQFRNRNRAIRQPQFFLKSATSSPQLESFTSATFGIFLAVESGRLMKKKIGGKKSHATVPLRQIFGFQRNRRFKRYFWVILKTIFS